MLVAMAKAQRLAVGYMHIAVRHSLGVLCFVLSASSLLHHAGKAAFYFRRLARRVRQGTPTNLDAAPNASAVVKRTSSATAEAPTAVYRNFHLH